MIFLYLFLMPFLMFLFRENEYHMYSVMFVWNILLFIPVVTLFSDKQWKHFKLILLSIFGYLFCTLILEQHYPSDEAIVARVYGFVNLAAWLFFVILNRYKVNLQSEQCVDEVISDEQIENASV